MSEDLLLKLYRRHFCEPEAAIFRLYKHLENVELPFNLKSQMRELQYPPQPGIPNGWQSFIYYFVPDTDFGSVKGRNPDALHGSFLKSTDGIGLNLGCPVRLLRALDALAQLKPEDQHTSRADLKTSRSHLGGIEEILWVTGWRDPANIRRGGKLPGASGDVDWAFDLNGNQVFLEAKFRHSDWPRLSDQGTFELQGEGFLKNALHKFPMPSSDKTLHVVGITVFDNITKGIIDIVRDELAAAPQIHAVIFRSMIQVTHIISLDARVHNRLRKLPAIPSLSDFPVDYVVLIHRESRDRRVSLRKQETPVVPGNLKKPPQVFHWSIDPHGVKPKMLGFEYYRLDVPSHGPGGEPNFDIIPFRTNSQTRL